MTYNIFLNYIQKKAFKFFKIMKLQGLFILFLFFISNINLKAIDVLFNFSISPTVLSEQMTWLGGASISAVYNNWIFSIGSYNAINHNIKSDFVYKNEYTEEVIPRLINNYFEADIEKLIPINKTFFFSSDEDNTDTTNYGLSLSGMFGVNHAKYRVFLSRSETLKNKNDLDFGYCWYYSLSPLVGFFYEINPWLRVNASIGYRFAFNADYKVKEVENVTLSNKDFSGPMFLIKFQIGDVQ